MRWYSPIDISRPYTLENLLIRAIWGMYRLTGNTERLSNPLSWAFDLQGLKLRLACKEPFPKLWRVQSPILVNRSQLMTVFHWGDQYGSPMDNRQRRDTLERLLACSLYMEGPNISVPKRLAVKLLPVLERATCWQKAPGGVEGQQHYIDYHPLLVQRWKDLL